MGNTVHYLRNPTEEIPMKEYFRSLGEMDKYIEPRAPKDNAYYRYKDYRPDPTLHAAWFKNPLTEMEDCHMNVQYHPLCGKLELGMMNCLEAYGLPQGFYRCRLLMEDYTECISETKRFKRVKVMRKERVRQHRDGERDIKYAMPPKPGSFMI